MTGKAFLLYCPRRHCFILTAIIFSLAGGVGAEPKWLEEAINSADSITFDKEAPAAIIYDEADIKISQNGKAKKRLRFATKILTPLGIDHSILHVGIYSGPVVRHRHPY